MIHKGSIKKNQFSVLYALAFRYNGEWVGGIIENGDWVSFALHIPDYFETKFIEEYEKEWPSKPLTWYQKIVKYLHGA